MYFSKIFVGILLLLSIIIIPPFVYASNDKSLSPLMQLNNGTSTQNIACSNDLELIYKSTNDYPACVKSQTSGNLLKHRWGTLHPNNYLIKVSGILVHYNFTGGNIQGSKLFLEASSIVFSVKMTHDGVLNVTLPRTLLNGTCNVRCSPTLVGTNVPFMAMSNDQMIDMVNIKEIKTTSVSRTLSIHIPNGTEKLEIFTTQLV